MKKFRKVFILFTLAFSLIGTGCDGMFGDKPETTEKTITNVNDENFPKDDDGNPLFPEGTSIEFKKVEEGDKTTTDYTAKWPNGTETVFHEVEEGKEDQSGKMITTVTSKSETTFSESDTSGKKSEVVETSVTDEFAATKGEVKEIKTTTEFKDGTKDVSTKNTEGKTGNFTESIVTTDKNGNKTASEEIKHTEIPETNQKWNDDGIKVSSTEESTKFTYDAQGKEATKVVTETTNPSSGGFFNKQVQTEYTYVNGVAQIKKRTEQLNSGCNELKTYDYDTGKISVTVKKLTGSETLGTGSGTIDGNKSTINIKYTNGVDLTTVEENDKVTKEIYVVTQSAKSYYEKTVAEKGVLKSKECEYLYDSGAGVVFYTITTYSGETETRKSSYKITTSIANYTEKPIEVPNNDGIYNNTDHKDIYADKNYSDAGTKFYTKIWNGPKGIYETIDYPYDSSVTPGTWHLPAAN